jgi:hypothetical protein
MINRLKPFGKLPHEPGYVLFFRVYEVLISTLGKCTNGGLRAAKKLRPPIKLNSFTIMNHSYGFYKSINGLSDL